LHSQEVFAVELSFRAAEIEMKSVIILALSTLIGWALLTGPVIEQAVR
jgi:hypothetical protein